MPIIRGKPSLFAAASVSALAFASPTLAQDSPTDSAGDDIIVTARRVEERQQDVPISLTVFNQADITKRNIAVATDLAAYTPSLSVNQRYGPEKASFSIRGFNQDQATAPTVGVYFAEVVGVRAQGGTTSGNTVGAGAFMDLQNVQILKGPQGTLFGRNTTGGAILLTPQKPTGALEGYVEGTYGNFDQRRVQGALNLPLADAFKVRLAADRNKRDGFMKNVSGIGPKHYNDLDYFAGRLSIVAELTPDLENYTVAHISDSHTNGYATRIIGCATPSSSFNPLVADPTLPDFDPVRLLMAGACADQLTRQTARGDSLYEIDASNTDPFVKIRQWQVINTTTWRASDTLTIKNVMSYGEFREDSNFDLGTGNLRVGAGGFPLAFFGIPGGVVIPAGTPFRYVHLDNNQPGEHTSHQSTFTEELQIQGKSSDGRLAYVIGGYLEFSRPMGFNGNKTGYFTNCTRPRDFACTNPLLIGVVLQTRTRYAFDNHGVFAQASYSFTDQLSLTAGARYTFDKIEGLSQGYIAALDPTGSLPGTFADPRTGVLIRATCFDSVRYPGKVVSDITQCETRLTNKSNKPTWVIDLDYKPSADILLYIKYARGYRQGGINFTNPGLETWGPEKLDSYEAGVKSSFRGAVRGYFNLAGFYNKLSDQQVFGNLVAKPNTGIAGGAGIINAGKSRAYGVEADASATLFESLRFDLGYTYLNTKIQEIDVSGFDFGPTPFQGINPQSPKGSPFTLSPKHKLTVTGTYTLPLEKSLGDLSLSATWVHTSSYLIDASVPATIDGFGVGRAPSTDLINLNLDWRSVAGSPIDLALFATNVTKEKYAVAAGGSWASTGVGDILLNQPRFYGLRLRYNFGQE